MPVQLPNPELDFVGQYNRLSASQVNTWKACPRLWYYEKVRRFVMPQIPILYVGRAVEEAICKTLKESPSLIVSSAPADIYAPTPLDDEGRPDRNYDKKWPAEQLLLLPDSKWPTNSDSLLEWANQRVLSHLAVCLEEMRIEWSKHDRKAGDWEADVDIERCKRMATNGIRLHMDEVNSCMTTVRQEEVDAWRTGKRDFWPAPDGRGYSMDVHPLAQTGAVTLIEAWEIARPWFVDPDAKPFMMNAVHPEHWFQGEYDLVYRWGGQKKIVDIKASLGNSDRSGDYVEQLRMYAYLWWSTHDQEPIDSLEIWYLAADTIKTIEVPSEMELEELGAELQSMWSQLREETPRIERCPPDPAPMRSFGPGGVPSDEAPKMSRCQRCDWSHICPGGEFKDEHPNGGSFHLPGLVTETEGTPLDAIKTRHTVTGQVHAIINGNRPRITIAEGNSAFADVQIQASEYKDGGPTMPEDLKKGDLVCVENAFFQINYKGALILKVDPFARVVRMQEGDEEISLHTPRARWNVIGTVVYRTEKRGVSARGDWCRKGLMLMDEFGSLKVEGWQADWGTQYGMLKPGDRVVITNIGIDGWAALTKGEMYRSSRLHILHD
ncbi:MAG TPA: hypothetical protein D7I00_01805 [Candidatus Poseidoniales archaeon]|nr:MAG TPA: hypothetical protein D7I00_01805 [Candidatus Poseidoniales archaeon]HII24477.1 PD-(D/E)XK nuclease family protein [Candidatus Poseidoniaceae archaeon]|tara:strand:+ start:7492 stop:9312 length:1821 start_codon:yes stop_codon:yes gene_type:complete